MVFYKQTKNPLNENVSEHVLNVIGSIIHEKVLTSRIQTGVIVLVAVLYLYVRCAYAILLFTAAFAKFRPNVYA